MADHTVVPAWRVADAPVGVVSYADRWYQASVALLALANIAVLFSIAVCQILLGMALAAMLASRRRWETPPLWKPLAAFAAWTVVTLLLVSPVARGFPQVKKFYIFLILLLGYSLLRKAVHSEWVSRALFAMASIAALVSMVEFARAYLRLRADGHDFYTSYTLSRITGFMGHWMTFSGQEMLVLMLLLAWLLSKPEAPRWAVTAGWCAAGAIVVALLLAFTRSVWVACFAGACYLLWKSHRRWLIALPVAVVIAYLAAPEWLQMRARSIADRNDNSVQARLLMWKAGLAMVKDRPVFGVGPDGVKYEFDRYRPDTYVPPAWYGHLHNNYVQMAAERGLPGLLLFLWLIFAALSDQWRIARQAGARAYLARGAVAATIALLVAGFFEYNFGDSEVAMLWLFLLVHGYTEGRQTTPAHEEHPEPEALAVV